MSRKRAPSAQVGIYGIAPAGDPPPRARQRRQDAPAATPAPEAPAAPAKPHKGAPWPGATPCAAEGCGPDPDAGDVGWIPEGSPACPWCGTAIPRSLDPWADLRAECPGRLGREEHWTRRVHLITSGEPVRCVPAERLVLDPEGYPNATHTYAPPGGIPNGWRTTDAYRRVELGAGT